MNKFDIHTAETASPTSSEMLASVQKSYGFVPNLYGVFAESPAMLKAYMSLGKIFDESSFSPTERQVIILAASRLNECHYCMAAHSVVAGMQNVPEYVVDAIRNDLPIVDPKLEALRSFAAAMVEKRGWVSDGETDAFLAAGYTKAQILEVVLGISFKTLSNYTNHVAETPLDSAFSQRTWTAVTPGLASQG